MLGLVCIFNEYCGCFMVIVGYDLCMLLCVVVYVFEKLCCGDVVDLV